LFNNDHQAQFIERIVHQQISHSLNPAVRQSENLENVYTGIQNHARECQGFNAATKCTHAPPVLNDRSRLIKRLE